MDMASPMVCQGCPQEPDKLPGRMVFLPAFFFGWIMWNAYSGKLTSFLAAQKEHLPFTSLEGMLYHTKYTMVFPEGTNYLDAFKVLNVQILSNMKTILVLIF